MSSRRRKFRNFEVGGSALTNTTMPTHAAERRTGGLLSNHSTDPRDWCRISIVASAPTGFVFVKKRRAAVLIHMFTSVVQSEVHCDI